MNVSREQYDAIVIGVGGMDSATVYRLAERGLERWDYLHPAPLNRCMSTDTDDILIRFKRPLLHVMGVFYAAAGVMHFVAPKVYARVVPPQFPRPIALVYLSGIAELVLGVGVLIRRTRQRSAWGLIALLVAVFPANVHMATSDVATDAVPDWANRITRAAMWARLPFQGILILWAWWYTHSPPENSE